MLKLFNLYCQKGLATRPVLYIDQLKRSGIMTPDLTQTAYALLQQAEQAAKGNVRYTERVLREKMVLLYSDLNEHNPGTENMSRNQLTECGLKLAELTQLGAKFKTKLLVGWSTDMTRDWLKANFFIHPTSAEWYSDPALALLRANPNTALLLPPTLANPINGGQQLQYLAIGGGVQGKGSMAIHRSGSGYGRAVAWFRQAAVPSNGIRLEVVGTASDPKTLLELRMNGTSIFSGPVPVTNPWRFEVPSTAVEVGLNKVELLNITPDKAGLTEDEMKIKNDPETPHTLRSRLWHPQNYYGWGVVTLTAIHWLERK